MSIIHKLIIPRPNIMCSPDAISSAYNTAAAYVWMHGAREYTRARERERESSTAAFCEVLNCFYALDVSRIYTLECARWIMARSVLVTRQWLTESVHVASYIYDARMIAFVLWSTCYLARATWPSGVNANMPSFILAWITAYGMRARLLILFNVQPLRQWDTFCLVQSSWIELEPSSFGLFSNSSLFKLNNPKDFLFLTLLPLSLRKSYTKWVIQSVKNERNCPNDTSCR